MGDAQRIRKLAAKNVAPDSIAGKLKIRPAMVRRVLGRSAQRGAPRKRAVSIPLSFVTTPEVAAMLRATASARGIPVSSVIDELVQSALMQTTASSNGAERPAPLMAPVVSISKGPRPRTKTARGAKKHALVTAADTPESVRQLLKSYDPKALRWRVRNDRYAIVVAILTRGGEEAMQWLWSILSHGKVRELVREYRGASCAEPDRVKLREQLQLTTADIPTRPYIGFGTELPRAREHS